MSVSEMESGKAATGLRPRRAKRHVTEKGKKVIEQYLFLKDKQRRLEYERRLGEIFEFGLSLGIFRDVLKAKSRLSRLMWISLGVAAVVFAVIQLNIIFTNFLSRPTQTKITYNVNTSILFPVVTVCSYSRVNATKIRNLNISDDLLAYMMSAFKGMYSYYNEYNIRQQQEALDVEYQSLLGRLSISSNFSLTTFFIEQGFDCSSFLVKCMFQGTDFSCCDSMPILSEAGTCFSVESQTFESQTIPGPNGGLKITIDNAASSYPNVLVNANPDLGVLVHIIHPDTTSKIGSSPLVIFPGTHAMVNLNAVYQELLPHNGEWSCIPEGRPPPKGFLKFFASYSFENCFIECVATMTMQTCGCIQIGSIPDINLLEEPQKDLCSPGSATSCVQPLLQADNMGFLWDIYDIKENCRCPLPCVEWQYERAVSYSSSPNPGYEKARAKLLSNLNDQANPNASVQSNMGGLGSSPQDEIIIDIFFDSLVYRTIEEVEIETYTSFLSSVGGQLALWLGFRLITAVHLCYYALLGLLKLFPVWCRSAKRVGTSVSRNVSARMTAKTSGEGRDAKAPFRSLAVVSMRAKKLGGSLISISSPTGGRSSPAQGLTAGSPGLSPSSAPPSYHSDFNYSSNSPQKKSFVKRKPPPINIQPQDRFE